MHTILRTVLVSGTTAAIVASGSLAASAATGRSALALHVQSNDHVAAPGTTRPGTVQLVNTGTRAIFILRKHAKGVAKLVADLNKQGQAPGPLIADYPIRDLLDAEHDAYLHLSGGTYYLVDAEITHKYSAADVKTLRVSGGSRSAAVPRSRSLTVSSHNRVSGPSSVPVGRYLHIKNHDKRLQVLAVFEVGSGTSSAQLDDFVASPSYRKLDKLQVESNGELAILGGGQSAYVDGFGASGRYLVFAESFGKTTKQAALTKGRVIRVDVP